MSTVQTHAAPDLVTFDRIDIKPAEYPDGTREVVRVGTVAIPVIKLSDGTVAVTVSDLRSLVKEGYRCGWNGKAIHQRQLIADLTKGIGT